MHGTFQLLAAGGIGNRYKRWKTTPQQTVVRALGHQCFRARWNPETGDWKNETRPLWCMYETTSNLREAAWRRGRPERDYRGLLLGLIEALIPHYAAAKNLLLPL